MGLDTRNDSNPTARLMLTILAGVATWEREIMLERQREGIAKAKSEGPVTRAGRHPSMLRRSSACRPRWGQLQSPRSSASLVAACTAARCDLASGQNLTGVERGCSHDIATEKWQTFQSTGLRLARQLLDVLEDACAPLGS